MEYEIFYKPHRIECTAVATSPVTIRYQFMPLYGPQEWFDFEPRTITASSFGDLLPSEGENSA